GDTIDRDATHLRVRTVDHLGIDRRSHRLDHALARALRGEVDRAGALPIEGDVRLLCRDERLNAVDYIAAGEVLRLDFVHAQINAGLFRADAGVDDHAVGHLPESHRNEVDDAHVCAREPGAEPYAEEREDDADDDETDDRAGNEEDD